MSFRDIGAILNKAIEEKEASKEQAEKMSQSTQAYKLFSEGKSPIQVSIALNIQEPEVAKFHIEYWKLVQHHSISRIYEEIKDDDIGYFVNLYRLAKATGMGIPHVINLLSIANNNLPSVEYRYEQLQRQISVLEFDKRSSVRDFQTLNDQIITMGKTLNSRLECQKEMVRLQVLQQERIKQEALVKHFENNNEEYINIVNTIKDKVHNTYQIRKLFYSWLSCLYLNQRELIQTSIVFDLL